MYLHAKPENIKEEVPKENPEKIITTDDLQSYVSEAIQKLIDEGVIKWVR